MKSFKLTTIHRFDTQADLDWYMERLKRGCPEIQYNQIVERGYAALKTKTGGMESTTIWRLDETDPLKESS